MRSTTIGSPARWPSWLVVAAVTVVVLLPWWRKHSYPRSLFDPGVVMGGINKINRQRMALGLVCAWAVRAGLTGRAGWARVTGTLLYYFSCLALPVLAEMAWTGASFGVWWHNVVALPAASRSGMLFAAF